MNTIACLFTASIMIPLAYAELQKEKKGYFWAINFSLCAACFIAQAICNVLF